MSHIFLRFFCDLSRDRPTESIATEQIQARVLTILKTFAHIVMELYLKNGGEGLADC